MIRKLWVLIFLIFAIQTAKKRLLTDLETDTDGEEQSPSEIEPLEDQDSKQELIVRPQDINVSLLQHAFKDTVLNLKAENNIRIKIKVHNQKFLPFFN